MQSNTQQSPRLTPEDLEKFIVDFLGEQLDVAPEEIDRSAAFDRFGVDSVIAVALTAELQEFTKRSVSPTLLYKYQNVTALAGALATATVRQ